ncbi:MAG: hypothetical protein EA401_03815 [Planctomycetota bacterium]|nr:MAG: hypothetical protein EA401_03815 [Planctomycetota bacterium]
MGNACATTVIVRRPAWDSDFQNTILTLTLHHDMDWSDTRRVRSFVGRFRDAHAIIVDCAEVDITSTAAVGWLVTLYRWCVLKQLDFHLANPGLESLATYRANGLDGLLPIAA